MSRSVRVFLEFAWIHTIGETQDGLHMCAAGGAWKGTARSAVTVFRPIAVTPPSNGRDPLVDVGLTLCAGVAGNHVKVRGKGDLCMVDLLIIGLECCRIDFGILVPIHVPESGCPFKIQSASNRQQASRSRHTVD